MKTNNSEPHGGAYEQGIIKNNPSDIQSDKSAKPRDKAKTIVTSGAKNIALIAVAAAVITGGKFVIQFIPNVEPVTLLLALYTCVFGFKRTFVISLIFCALDMILYSFSPDVAISYFIYWPLLTVVIKLVNLKKTRSEYINAFASALMTILFGVITSAARSIMTGAPFMEIYLFGLPFFAIHTGANFIIILFAFKPLLKALIRIKAQYNF